MYIPEKSCLGYCISLEAIVSFGIIIILVFELLTFSLECSYFLKYELGSLKLCKGFGLEQIKLPVFTQ